MKKSLLIFTFLLTAIFTSAQICTPDSDFASPGIYPDTATGLDAAYVGLPYTQTITVITPTDTVVDFNGSPIPVTVEEIAITSLTGLPSNFTYDCLALDCIFPGGSVSCAVLTSISDPTVADIGSYQIIINTTTTVDAGLGFPITQDDVIDYYYLEITNTASSINYFDNTAFELKSAYPNPVINHTTIQFVSGSPEIITFKVYNLLGKEVDSQLISSSIGVNTISLSTSSYSEGMYLYSVNNGSKVLTKRMIVKN